MRPVSLLRTLVAERFLLAGSALLAIAALGSGRVAIREVPSLLDVRLLMLFAVLAIAVELGRVSRLFDDAVIRVARRVRTARGLAIALTLVTGILAMFLTNDVALFLIVPFTLLFTRVAKIDLAPIVALEISSANVVGALTPIGNPQNLFLYGRGGFSPVSFVEAQLPIVAFGALLLAALAWRLIPRTAFTAPAAAVPPVDRLRAAGFAVLLCAEAASIVGAIRPRFLSLWPSRARFSWDRGSGRRTSLSSSSSLFSSSAWRGSSGPASPPSSIRGGSSAAARRACSFRARCCPKSFRTSPPLCFSRPRRRRQDPRDSTPSSGP